MSRLVDTQIVSLAFKGKDEEAATMAQSSFISSITASEFLLSQGKGADKPDYYVLPARPYLRMAMGAPDFEDERRGNKKWARMAHRHTDQFILDFGSDLPQIIEYGSRAISTIINHGYGQLYRFCVSHLVKQKQKYLIKRCEYLCQNQCQCLPLTKQIGEFALKAMDAFLSKYNAKANPRNTVNDVLILATARTRKLKLSTKDSLLNRFSGEFLGGTIQKKGRRLSVDFSGDSTRVRRRSPESKGYINRGWQVRLL